MEQKLADPQTNMSHRARYLRYLLDLFPGHGLAVAAYNAGEGAVQRPATSSGKPELREDGDGLSVRRTSR